jgi:hypothetical protein
MELVHQVVSQRVEALKKNYISRQLELDELDATMKELKYEKSLGLDGFPIKFYK